MTNSARIPVATPIQVFATSLVGSPLAGWLLMRRTARRFDDPARNLGSSPWLVIGWLACMAFVAWALPIAECTMLFPPRGVGEFWLAAHFFAAWLQALGHHRWLRDHAPGHPRIGWLDPVRIAMFFLFSAWALALLTLVILDPRRM